MIFSHDRQKLFIGVPKNGSQTARAVLAQMGVDLVGEMGRHPTVPEAIRLVEDRFPGETVAPTAIYAFWRDPVERFCSALEFHKRCLPNSFIQLFPERFIGIEPHNRWFETDARMVAPELLEVIDSITPREILGVLAPPRLPGSPCNRRERSLSFYRPQSEWLAHTGLIILPFTDYEISLRHIVDHFGGIGALVDIPRINCTGFPLPTLNEDDIQCIRDLLE
jgi:hypothetical protein